MSSCHVSAEEAQANLHNYANEMTGMEESLTRTVVHQAAQIAALRSALERTESNFRNAVNGLPVRDMAENLAENHAAMKASA